MVIVLTGVVLYHEGECRGTDAVPRLPDPVVTPAQRISSATNLENSDIGFRRVGKASQR
jgi:hypothetical protein